VHRAPGTHGVYVHVKKFWVKPIPAGKNPRLSTEVAHTENLN